MTPERRAEAARRIDATEKRIAELERALEALCDWIEMYIWLSASKAQWRQWRKLATPLTNRRSTKPRRRK